jgi:hypothetical protein
MEKTKYPDNEFLKTLVEIRILKDSLTIFESPLYKVIPSFDTLNLLICWKFNHYQAIDTLVRLIDEQAMDEIIEANNLSPGNITSVSEGHPLFRLSDKAALITASIYENILADILGWTDQGYNDCFHVLFYGTLARASKKQFKDKLRTKDGKEATFNETMLRYFLSDNPKDFIKLHNELIRATNKRIQTHRKRIERDDADSEIKLAFLETHKKESETLAEFPSKEVWEYITRPCPLSLKLQAPEGWDNYLLWEKRETISFALEKFPPFYSDIKEDSMFAEFTKTAEKNLKAITEDSDQYQSLTIENKDGKIQEWDLIDKKHRGNISLRKELEPGLAEIDDLKKAVAEAHKRKPRQSLQDFQEEQKQLLSALNLKADNKTLKEIKEETKISEKTTKRLLKSLRENEDIISIWKIMHDIENLDNEILAPLNAAPHKTPKKKLTKKPCTCPHCGTSFPKGTIDDHCLSCFKPS